METRATSPIVRFFYHFLYAMNLTFSRFLVNLWVKLNVNVLTFLLCARCNVATWVVTKGKVKYSCDVK